MSGLGDYNASDLKKILAGKTANVRISLSDINENFYGSSNTKDVETMLQMVHVYFVKPRFDVQAYKVLESNINNYIIRRSKDIGEQMRDSLTIALYGKDNPKEPIFNESFAAKISFDKIKSVYQSRFADASDFDFYIVGDISADLLKPLLTKYLASIPTKNTLETFKDNQAEWVSDKIDQDIYLKMEDPKSSVRIAYKKDMPYSEKNVISTEALGDIMQLRILETVREQEGGAYSPQAYAVFSREPKSQAYLSVSFDCNPNLADKLVGIVHNELQKMADGTINDEDLNKTKTNFIKEREQSKDKNAYDMQLLTTFFRYGLNMNDPKNYEDIVNALNKEDIQQIANQLIEGGKTYDVVFRPKQQ
jgi:zinc protease